MGVDDICGTAEIAAIDAIAIDEDNEMMSHAVGTGTGGIDAVRPFISVSQHSSLTRIPKTWMMSEVCLSIVIPQYHDVNLNDVIQHISAMFEAMGISFMTARIDKIRSDAPVVTLEMSGTSLKRFSWLCVVACA